MTSTSLSIFKSIHISGLDTLPAMGAVALAILLEDVVLLGVSLYRPRARRALVVAAGAAVVGVVRNVL